MTASLPVQAGDKVWILLSRFATNVVSLQQAADWRHVPYVFRAAQRAELSFALVVWDVAKVVPHVVAAATSQPDEVVADSDTSSAHPCRSIPTEAKSIAMINCVKDMAWWTQRVTCKSHKLEPSWDQWSELREIFKTGKTGSTWLQGKQWKNQWEKHHSLPCTLSPLAKTQDPS